MLPADLEELQACGKPNISEEPVSAQQQLWAKKAEDLVSSPQGRTLLISLCPRQAPALPLSAGAKGHGTPGAVSYPWP